MRFVRWFNGIIGICFQCNTVCMWCLNYFDMWFGTVIGICFAMWVLCRIHFFMYLILFLLVNVMECGSVKWKEIERSEGVLSSCSHPGKKQKYLSNIVWKWYIDVYGIVSSEGMLYKCGKSFSKACKELNSLINMCTKFL